MGLGDATKGGAKAAMSTNPYGAAALAAGKVLQGKKGKGFTGREGAFGGMFSGEGGLLNIGRNKEAKARDKAEKAQEDLDSRTPAEVAQDQMEAMPMAQDVAMGPQIDGQIDEQTRAKVLAMLSTGGE